MSKRVRAGMVLECTPQGPDALIYPYVLRALCAGMDVEKPETMTNKKRLIEEGPKAAKLLFGTGCDVVFIIWDRMPKWGGTGKCAETEALLEAGLQAVEVDLSKVVLCCIDEELESWMVADGRGVTEYFKAKTVHPLEKFKDAGPEKAKDRIGKYWAKYNEFVDDFGIVKAMPDFDRAAKGNASFGRYCAAVRRWCGG